MARQITFGLGGYDPTKPNDNIVEDIEIPDPPQEPLDEIGVLTTLLVVTGVLTLEDGANAVRREPANLVAEAQAWAVALNIIATRHNTIG